MTTADDLILAVAMLRRGGVVAFPTETVYGLGADAQNAAAVARIFTIKGRPSQHPLIVHLASAVQMHEWAQDIPAAAHELAARFWPGPLTLILRRANHVLDSVTGGQDSVALRVPAHPLALDLLQRFGGGLAAPSANRFGRISPTQKDHVQADLGAAVDMILDGGPCELGLESTIVSLLGETPIILRPGAISHAALVAALGCDIEQNFGHDPAVRAPGMLDRHYAPHTPLRLIPTARLFQEVSALCVFGQSVGVLEMQREPSKVPFLERGVHRYILPDAPEQYAQRLYASLRLADAAQHDQLFVELPPQSENWLAVNDRLGRAAHIDLITNSQGF